MRGDRAGSYAQLLFNTLIVTLPKYSSSVGKRYPSIYVISFIREKNGNIKIVSSLFAIKLCFVVNVLNNKTITLLNFAEHPLILANST